MRRGVLNLGLEAIGLKPHLLVRSPPASALQPVPIPPSSLKDPSFVLVPLGVLVAGFGALLLFWIGGEPRVDVPGLFDYAAATLGDGLLLPLLALACVFALASVSAPAPNERGWTLVATLGGVGVGATIQALWLLDPAPT